MARSRAGIIGAVAALAVAAMAVGCARDTSSDEEKPSGPKVMIRQKGAATMWSVSMGWGEAFQQRRPEVEFDFHYLGEGPGGTGRAINDLIAGKLEIANASREATPEEIKRAQAAGVNLVAHVVAYDGIIVTIHERNPLVEMDMRTLSDIFSGKTTQWWQVPGVSGLGEIVVYIREPDGSATYEEFKRKVVTLDGAEPDRDYLPTARREAWDELIASAIPDDPNSIGYHGLSNLGSTFTRPLALVPLGGKQAVAPTPENILSGAYPLSRKLICYTNGEPTGALKDYLDFIESLDGQQVVASFNTVPLPEARAELLKRAAERARGKPEPAPAESN